VRKAPSSKASTSNSANNTTHIGTSNDDKVTGGEGVAPPGPNNPTVQEAPAAGKEVRACVSHCPAFIHATIKGWGAAGVVTPGPNPTAQEA